MQSRRGYARETEMETDELHERQSRQCRDMEDRMLAAYDVERMPEVSRRVLSERRDDESIEEDLTATERERSFDICLAWAPVNVDRNFAVGGTTH